MNIEDSDKHSDGSDYVLESDSGSISPCDSNRLHNSNSDGNLQFIEITESVEKNNITGDQNNIFNQINKQITKTEELISDLIPERKQNILHKTCSTGDLRLYHKTDLKKKINIFEMRVAHIENKLTSVENKMDVLTKDLNKNQESNNYNILKWIGFTLICLHVGKFL